MPSAEETTYLFKVMPETTQEFITRDVDLLVSQIKENLRLSGFKAKSSVSHKNHHRPSPYRVPSRSWAEPGNCEICGTRNNNGTHDHRHHHHHHHHHHHNHKRNQTTREDDPYVLLQELLREGGLIKEAVKRLQTDLEDYENSEDDLENVDVDDEEEEEEEEDEDETSEERQRRRQQQQQLRDSKRDFFYRRKPYYYDSEDEPLPPAYEPLEL